MTTLSVADARAQFSKIVESASTTHERFEVTRNGRRVAVVLGAEDFDALVEPIDMLSDRSLMSGIARTLVQNSGGRDLPTRERRARVDTTSSPPFGMTYGSVCRERRGIHCRNSFPKVLPRRIEEWSYGFGESLGARVRDPSLR